MGSNGTAVAELLRATADVDADTAVELVTEDFVYEVVDLDTYRGPDGMRTFLADQSSLMAVHRELGRFVESGDDVAVERVDTMVFAVGPVAVPTAAFFTCRDGRVAHWIDYQDLREVARTLGH